MKEHFRSNSILGRELDCYEALSSKSGLDKYTAEKLVFRAKKSYDSLDQQKIFEEQSKVISKINKDVGKEVYNNFVPNYQSLASISQLFGDRMPVKTKVLMEQKIIERLIDQEEQTNQDMKSIDTLVVRSFTDNFNETYDNLYAEQKELLNKYVNSFDESKADFRLFVGSELKRIYESVSDSLVLEDVSEDPDMVMNTKKVLERIQSMNVSKIGDKEILKILKLQNLTREYNSDAN